MKISGSGLNLTSIYRKPNLRRKSATDREDNEPVGILRYNLFWDNTPFCTMLYIRNDKHGFGYGLSLMKHWEDDMKTAGILIFSIRDSNSLRSCS